MFKHYLLTILRHLWKRRLYSFISLVSLTLGLSITCLTLLHVRYELSYNRGWPDAERVYRVTTRYAGANADQPRSANVSDEIHSTLTGYLDDLAEAHVTIGSIDSTLQHNQAVGQLRLAVAGSALPELFVLTEVVGDMERVMQETGLIALERERATMLFGSGTAALGERIVLGGQASVSANPDFVPAEAMEFEVAAIYEIPGPVTDSVNFQAVAPDNAYTGRLFGSLNGVRLLIGEVWAKLGSGMPVEQANALLNDHLRSHVLKQRQESGLSEPGNSALPDYRLQALSEVYFGDVPERPQGDVTRLLTYGIVALLVLLAGCSNVVSMSLAIAMERRCEVGIRKSIGALQQNIMLQYLGESLVLALLALLPVLALVELLHAPVANLLGITAMPTPGSVDYLLMLGVVLVVGLVNGAYPAFVLSRVKPVVVLKAQAVQPRFRRLNFRSVLVGLQFGFSIVLLIITTGLYLQLRETRNQPLGLNAQNLAVAAIDFKLLQSRADAGVVLAEELMRVPGIDAAVLVGSIPLISPGTAAPGFELVANRQETSGVKAQRISVKPGFFSLLEIPLLAGRDFDNVRDALQQIAPGEEMPPQSVIVNRVAMQALGFSDVDQALGERFVVVSGSELARRHLPVEIVGVVENSMVSSVRRRPGPEFYTLGTSMSTQVLFRYHENAAAQLAERVPVVLQELSGIPGNLWFLDDNLEQVFSREKRESRLLLLCAAIALGLSCIGLYGLVSVALRTQVKEIGVRKVLGADTSSIVGTFLRRFSLPVLLANLVAWPVAVYFVLRWIQQFPYQLDKAWLLPICLGITAMVLLVAWLTVSALTWRAASMRPVKSLRYE